MRCIVCGKDFDSKVGECPACGFEMMGWTGSGDQQEYMRIVEEMAGDYRKELRRKLRVELLVPSYEQSETGEIQMKSEDQIVLTRESEMGTQVRWYPEKFARMDAGESILLRLSIKGILGKTISREVKLTAPDWGSVFWRIGIREEEKLHFRVVLGADGDSGKYLESESISMVYES